MSKTPSRIHSSFDAAEIGSIGKEIAAIFAGDFGLDDCAELAKIGIGIDKRSIAALMQANGYAMDNSTIQQSLTTASIAVPVQFLQNWLPGFVKIITAARKIDDIVGMSTVGSWEDEEIVQPILENTGSALPYGDITNAPMANWNVNFNTRTVVRFELGMRVGVLEEARAARIRVNSGESKRESAGVALEQQRNAVGFYGYNSGNNNTYGFLNDPSLPAYVQVAAGVGGRNWSQKTFLEICADLRTAIVTLRTQSDDTIDPEKLPITLAVATAAVDYLSTVSDFGISVRDWLKQTYPNVRVVSAPQLNNANASDNVFYMFADRVDDLSTDDGKTFIQIVPAKFQVLGVQKLAKGYEEDYSNATAGIMTKRPYAVVRFYNI